MNFKIIREGKDVTIVRTKSSAKQVGTTSVQRVKVMCFESERVERIFRIQENVVNSHTKK